MISSDTLCSCRVSTALANPGGTPHHGREGEALIDDVAEPTVFGSAACAAGPMAL